MDKTNIRKKALTWFTSKYPAVEGEIYTSKFFPAAESWSKSRVWFFQLPLEVIHANPPIKIHLICENHLAGEPFIYLKISSLFFLKKINSFEVSEKEKVVRIYLSAEAVNMFTEVRGKGGVDFKDFVSVQS
ncbi:MAG: hypothetical protein JSS80_11790 [Bacteroidetes bacterium]|nr:hypothetical protein [Bacteroidota bacterium]